jgi:HlyD family secretion protein
MSVARRFTGLAVALVILGGAGFGIWRWKARHAKPPVEYDTVTIDRGKIVARVTATGTLSALVTVQVGSQVSGRIAKLSVDYNTPVKRGQIIAKIDPQLFQAALEQARANHLAAQGNLAKTQAQERDAQRQFDRAKSLLERRLIAQADYDTAEANLDVAKGQRAASEGQLAQAAAALHQAQVNLAYTDIVSPTDGVVISRSVDVGQTVTASFQTPTLFVIAQDLRKMQVDTSVAEADVGRLQSGMEATFTVDAFPGERFPGVVRQIRNAAQTVQNVVTYDAVIDVANPDLKLRPGMTANVTFIASEKDDVLRVANAGVRFRPPPEMFAALGMTPPARRGDGSVRAPAGAGHGASANGAPSSGAASTPTPGAAPSGSGPRGTSAAPQAAGAVHGGDAGPGTVSPGGRGRRGEVSDRRVLWLLKGGQPRSVPVRVGLSDGSLTEITEGDVHEGDTVITDVTVNAQVTTTPSAGPPSGPFRRMGL